MDPARQGGTTQALESAALRFAAQAKKTVA
jgi:hypothetical protein